MDFNVVAKQNELATLRSTQVDLKTYTWLKKQIAE